MEHRGAMFFELTTREVVPEHHDGRAKADFEGLEKQPGKLNSSAASRFLTRRAPLSSGGVRNARPYARCMARSRYVMYRRCTLQQPFRRRCARR